MTKTKFPWLTFIRDVAVIAVPVALQNLLTTTGSMVDTIMIAPLGEATVGAVGLCAQFSSLMFSCYWGFVGGGILFFSQYYGAGDKGGIDRAYGTTLMFLLAVGFLFAPAAIFFPDVVMRLYTDKVALQQIGVSYLRIVGFSYPFQVFSMAMCALLRSTGKPHVPMYGACISVGTNIFLNWVLIGGHLGAPALGVRGAALATVIASVVNALSVLIISLLQRNIYIFSFKGHFDWSREWFRIYLKKCFPIIVNELLIGIGFMILNVVLGRQSEEAIAALAVFRTLEGLVIGFFAGFSNASGILVGKGVGAGELRPAYERAKRLIYLCGGSIALVCLLLLLLSDPILTAMSLSGESLRIGRGMLTVYAVAAVIRMCNWTQNDTFRSAGDATFGTVLEISFMYATVVPAVILAGLVFKLPVLVVFALCYVDEPIRFALMQWHLYSGRWIKPVTPQGRAALPAFFESIRKRKPEDSEK